MDKRFSFERQVPYFERAALAAGNLDRSRYIAPDVATHGCYDCLDAPSMLPTGGFGLTTVIGSYAHCYRDNSIGAKQMDSTNLRPVRSAAHDKFEIVPLGIDTPDYFQGFGVAFTKYEHSAVGVGQTQAEAYDDAYESIAQVLSSEQFKALGLPEAWGAEEPNVIEELNVESYEEAETCEAQFYVGIRYNVEGT